MEPYGAPLNLWLYGVFYGALWSITKPKEPCGAMDHHEDQRSPMEPYGGLCNPMGLYAALWASIQILANPSKA